MSDNLALVSDEPRSLLGLKVACDDVVPDGVIFMSRKTWERLNPKPAKQEPVEHTHKQVYTIAEGWHCGSCGVAL